MQRISIGSRSRTSVEGRKALTSCCSTVEGAMPFKMFRLLISSLLVSFCGDASAALHFDPSHTLSFHAPTRTRLFPSRSSLISSSRLISKLTIFRKRLAATMSPASKIDSLPPFSSSACPHSDHTQTFCFSGIIRPVGEVSSIGANHVLQLYQRDFRLGGCKPRAPLKERRKRLGAQAARIHG